MAPCALLALFAAVAAGPVEEIPPPSGVDSGFGSVIDAHDGRLIIAAPTSSSGTGYAGIYEWQTDQWIETWSLDTNAMEPGDAAGASVALANDWAAIGVPGDHQVIMLNRGMDGSWHIDQIIDGPSDSTLFGSAIDIDGERMLIGAPGGNARISGYMIEQVDVDGDLIWQWIEQGSIQSPVGSGSGWGSAVSIEMEIGAAGIPEHNENSGGLYRLELESGSFQIIENCSTDIPWLLGNAGTAVDVRNQWILASAPGYAISENSGITWVLSQSADPDEENQWVFRTYMIPPPGIANAQFGESMTSSLTRACIGAPAADGGGMIFVYDLKVDGAEIDYLGQVQPDMISEGDQFGADLALLDGHLIVGAPGRDANGQDAGGVLVLDLENATEHVLDAAVPIEIAEHMPAHGNLIPSAIGVGTDRMVLGIPHANSNDGEVQVLQRTNGDWTLSSSIKGTASAMFGHSVEQTRNLTIIGSPGAEGGTGEVQIYREDEGSIVLEQTLSPLGLANSTFGYSIAVHSTAPDMSTYLAVGAPSIDLSSGIPDGRGRLYVYCNQNGTSDWDLILTREGVEPDSGFGMSVGVNELNDMIIACAGDPYLESKGAAWLYRGDENPANWTNLLSVSGEETGADFGMSVAIANKYIAIGAPGATTNAPGGAAYLVSGWDSDSLDSWHVLRPLDSIHEAWGFGKSVDITFSGSTYRIAVGLPGLEGNTQQWGAGGIDLFSGMESDGEWSVSRFNHHCRVIPLVPNRDNRLGGVVHFNEGVLYALNNSSDAPAVQDANESGIALFQNIDSSYWIREGGGNVNTASNWSVPPQENDELVFSLLGSIQYLVSMGGVANGHLRIAFDQILMVLNPEDSNTAKSMTIASPADIQSARVLLAEGGLMFEQEVTIGSSNPDESGSLYLVLNGQIQPDSMQQYPNGQMGCGFANLTDNSTAPIIANQVALAGSLRIEMTANLVDTLQVGDTFTIIHAATAPATGEDRFDLMVLPGLPNGLSLVPQYSENLRGAGGWDMILEVVDLSDLFNFGDPNSVPVEGTPIAMEVVDLTGDGADEICVIFDGAPGYMAIFENDGAGGVAQQVVVNTGNEPVDITSGDFDGDGTSDLAVANGGDDDVTVYYNEDSDITNGFTDLSVAIARTPTCLAGINYNFDGFRDLVIGVTDDDLDGNGDWLFYLATPAIRDGGFGSGGSLQAKGIPSGVDPAEDEDDKDLPFTGTKSNGKGAVAKFISAAAGPSLELVEYVVGADPAGLTNADINGDGLMDVAVTSRTNGTLALLVQDAASPGDFLGPTYISIGALPGDTTAVDFDLDGNIDLATVTTNEDGIRVVRVLQNDGNLSFTSIDLAEGELPILVAAGDIDGNGTRELVTIGAGSSLMRGDEPPVMSIRDLEDPCDCPGDANCDQAVNIDDILGILGEFGCVRDCLFDADGDGVSDVNDILLVISHWGDCN